jgi:hypothetical protein
MDHPWESVSAASGQPFSGHFAGRVSGYDTGSIYLSGKATLVVYGAGIRDLPA